MATGDDDDGFVWGTTLLTQGMKFPAVARGNASVTAALIASPPNLHSRIIATAERLADQEEPILTTLADHHRPDLIEELGLPVRNPAMVATWARGEIDRRRRQEETTKWTLGQIGGWVVAVIVSLIALIGIFFK